MEYPCGKNEGIIFSLNPRQLFMNERYENMVSILLFLKNTILKINFPDTK